MRSLSVKYGEKYHYIAHLDVPMGCKTYGMMTKNDDNFIPFIIKKSTFQSENIKTKFVGLTTAVLLFVFCLLLGGKAFGQNAFTIGSGTSTYYTPLPGWYGWQYDVYLYTPSDAAELNNDIILTSIAYDITNINSSTSVAEWNIWIKDVDASYTLSSTTTFSTFKSGAQLVYSSTTETITTTGWKTLNFSSGFNHEAGKAILVMVFGKGCTTGGGCARQCRYTEVQNSMWRNNVDSSTDPGTERTGTLDRYRANVKFTYTPPTVCEDFNSTSGSGSYSTGGVLPSGWNRIYAGTVYGNTETSPANMPHVTTSSNTTPGAPNSSNYICFYSSGSASEYSYAIMPAVPAGKAVSHLSFRYNFESAAYGTLTYGVINGTDANSYQVIGTVSNPSTNPGHIDIDLAVGATTGKRIAFRWYKTSTWYTCGIDDVCISTVSVAPTNYTVSVSANPSAGGTVSGGGTFSSGASCTVSATTNTCYTFSGWYENGSRVSTSASYTFTVSGNRTLEARYTQNTHTVSVSANPSAGGSVSGGGTKNCGTSTTVTATTNTCYTFDGWYENGSRVSTNASYTFTVSSNRTLEARYTQNTHTVSVSANPSAGGTVSGGGTFNCGTSPTVTATPNSGYHFVNWTEGGSQVSTSASYTISSISANHTLVANFEANSSGGDCAEVQIGSGTAVHNYLPTYIFYNYSLTQQIYTDDEIGNEAGDIVSVSFYAKAAMTRNLNVYMVATNKESFTGTNDWINVSASDLVFSGSVTFDADAWTTIALDNPFSYDGRQNVALIVDDNTGSYVSSVNSLVFDGTNQTIRIYSDGTNYDPESATSYTGTIMNVKNQIKFCIVPAVSVPDDFCVDFESGSMPVGWTSEGSGSAYWSVGIGDSNTSTGANTGSYNARITHSTSGNVTYLVSPEMDLSNVSSASLTFSYVNRSWAGDIDEIAVCYRVNGGTWTELFSTTSAHSSWTEQSVTLTGFAANYQIGFKFTDHYGYGVGLDDICFTFEGGASSSCGIIVYYDDFGGNDVQDERYAGPHKLADPDHNYTSGGGIIPATWTHAGDYTRCNYVNHYQYTSSQDFGDCRHHGNSNCTTSYTKVYAINKNTYHDASSNGWVMNKSDHTFADDVTRGYMFQADGTGDFYVKTITDVPAGDYRLSAWFMDVSSGGKCTLSVSGTTVSGSPTSGEQLLGSQGEWVQRYCDFTLTAQGSITITLYGSDDFACDDILVASRNNAPPTISMSLDHDCNEYPMVECLTYHYGTGDYNDGDGFSFTAQNENGCENTVERDATWRYYHIYYDYGINCNGESDYEVQDVPMWSCNPATVNVRPPVACSNKCFMRWATRANGGGSSYLPGDEITVGSNIYLYAIYDVCPNPCSDVTVMTCGQTYSGTLGRIGAWDSYPNVRDWTYDEVGEEKVYSFTPAVTGTYSFYGTTNDGDADFFLLSSCDNEGTEITHWDDAVFDDVSVSLSAGTTYYLIVDNYYGTSTSEYEVYVSLSSIANVTASASIVCNGSQVTLTAPSGGTTYTWTPSGSGSSAVVTPTVTANTTYRVTVWSGSSCSASSSVLVNVYNTITATASASRANYCQSETPSLTASVTSSNNNSPVTYQWYTAANAGSAISGATSATYTGGSRTAGSHTYYVRVSDGCTTTDFLRVDYNVYNTITATASASRANYCQSETPSLTASVTSSNNNSPVTYQWYTAANAGSAISGATSATYTGGSRTAGSHTYYVRVSDGCTTTDFLRVDYNVYNSITATASASRANYCQSETPSLTASVTSSNNSSPVTYQWYTAANAGSAISGATSATYTGGSRTAGSHTYYVRVSDGCTTTDFLRVDYNVYNSITATASASRANYCQSETPSLTASVTSSNNNSPVTYQWYTAANAGSAISGATSATYTGGSRTAGSHTYYVRVSDGCTTTDFIRVDYNVYNTITATASASRANYCQSETPSLTASVTSSNNNSPVTYQWYTAANAGNAISGATSATYTGGSRTAGSHTYYVRVSDGCTTTDFIRVDYNVYNTITATASASRANYCQSETPSLTASVTSSNNNSPVTYQWYTAANAGSAISGATSATYTGGSRTAGSHTYYVRVSDGCTTTDFLRVDYNVYGDLVSSAIANANDYCLNATATALSTTPSSGSGSYNYQWQYSTNGSTWNNTGSNSSSFTPPTTSTGTIYYRVIVSDNCSSVTMSSVQITVNDKPAVSAISAPDAICVGESLDLTAPTVIPNGSSILAEGWEISPSQNGTYTPFTNSNIQQDLDGYYIRYSATNGCGTTANAGVQITVNHPDISITSTCDYVWRGGTSNWNIASNWYEYNNGTYSIASELPSEAKNYYIAIGGSGTCLQDVQQAYMNSDATVNNIEVAPGAELHIMENVTLRLAGSIINNGTFVADNTSIIELNGANDQTLSSAMEFGNVTFAQVVDGKKIFAPHGITVNGVAAFTKGVIVGDMNFVSGATASEASLLSHVDGAVTKAFGSSAFTFPTGNGHTLGTIAVPATRSGGSATVRYRNVAGTNDLPSDYPRWWNANDNCDGNDPQFDHVSNIEFWNVSSNVALNNVTLMVSSAEVTDHFGAGATSYDDEDIFGAMWLGSCWKNIGGPGTVENGNTKISVNVSIRATRSSSNHYVTLGSKTPSTLLPIELVSFNAICDGKSVLVEWTTATERNNDYFVIEQSDDAINFTEIARVAGAGNSIEPLDYSYTDYGFHGGDNYYRLVQVDYDGSRTVSEIIVAACEEPEVGEPDVQAYPNPFNGELTLVLDNFENRPARIEVYDMLGKLIMFEKVDAPQNSYETILNLYNLPPAAYNVRVSTTDFVINRQVVKN